MRDSQIARVFDRADGPLSVNRVADELGVDWHTAKKWLEKEREAGNLYLEEMHGWLTLYWTRPLPFGGEE